MNAPERTPNTWEEDVIVRYRFRQRIIRVLTIAWLVSSAGFFAAITIYDHDARGFTLRAVYHTFFILTICGQFIANRCPACDVFYPFSLSSYRSGHCRKCNARLKQAEPKPIPETYHVTPEAH